MNTINNKKILGLSILSIFIFSCILATSPAIAAQNNEEGKFVDNIRVEVRTSQTTGIGDTATGKIDAFLYNVPGDKFEGLSEDMRQNLVL
ncbi:hypothetical protein AKJ50_00105 [candidate division MSBL1 archaeon SCGC-AAA382A13]|uniref:Uncharacterized protein n=1 Tax=candidate division MSBL1 archaeon SCGC-AAA382A13 TaxID=1698279 RepID=A0A133VH12_9EURY|nr:hypothetical protein AKJ50_00105 [candidate division MSBL1 archaeon SCGC-AAA382A13]